MVMRGGAVKKVVTSNLKIHFSPDPGYSNLLPLKHFGTQKKADLTEPRGRGVYLHIRLYQ